MLSSATTLWGRNKIVLGQRYDAPRDLTSSHFTVNESQTKTLYYLLLNPTCSLHTVVLHVVLQPRPFVTSLSLTASAKSYSISISITAIGHSGIGTNSTAANLTSVTSHKIVRLLLHTYPKWLSRRTTCVRILHPT
jgi:hypothetical protein